MLCIERTLKNITRTQFFDCFQTALKFSTSKDFLRSKTGNSYVTIQLGSCFSNSAFLKKRQELKTKIATSIHSLRAAHFRLLQKLLTGAPLGLRNFWSAFCSILIRYVIGSFGMSFINDAISFYQ